MANLVEELLAAGVDFGSCELDWNRSPNIDPLGRPKVRGCGCGRPIGDGENSISVEGCWAGLWRLRASFPFTIPAGDGNKEEVERVSLLIRK